MNVGSSSTGISLLTSNLFSKLDTQQKGGYRKERHAIGIEFIE